MFKRLHGMDVQEIALPYLSDFLVFSRFSTLGDDQYTLTENITAPMKTWSPHDFTLV